MKKSIDIASIIGLVVALGMVVFGIVVNADPTTGAMTITVANLGSFLHLPSALIVVGGTFGCLFLMFPMSQITRIPKHLRIIFLPNQYVPAKYIDTLVECAKKARISGLLALEEDATKMEDSFLRSSLQMVVDSVDPDDVKAQTEAWLENIDERHAQERAFYDRGAALGPAFGMIGTLVGLINMLKTLQDVSSVGPNMSTALITTLYGSLLANVIFAPISNKLRVRHEEEFLCMRIVCEGVQAIQAGENPNLIKGRLLHLLPEYQKASIEGGKKGGKKGGKPAEGAAKPPKEKGKGK